MKMKFGAIVVDGRGKIGGHVASKNRGGAYLRTKVTPSNPQTSFQAAVRNRLTNFSQSWRGITQNERNAWNSAVSNFTKTDIFGDIKQPSGINLFIKLNSNLDQVQVAALTLPPLPADVPAVISVQAQADQTGQALDVAYGPSPVPADTAFIVEVTAQVSPGRNFLKNEFRVLTFADAAAVTPALLGADYVTRFGALIAGQKIGVRIQPINKITGQKGQALSTSLIVAA